MAKTTLANVVSAGAPAMTGPAAIRAYASRVSTSREEVTVEATLPIAPSDRPWTGVTDYHCTNIGMNVQLCVRTDHPPQCSCGTASRPSSAEHSLGAVNGADRAWREMQPLSRRSRSQGERAATVRGASKSSCAVHLSCPAVSRPLLARGGLGERVLGEVEFVEIGTEVMTKASG